MESSEGYLLDDQELGLLDEEAGQQRPQTATNSGLQEPHDMILLDDMGGGESCDGEGEDETAPLLGKTEKKTSRDKKSRKERENETTEGKEGERTDRVTEKRRKKEKGERSSKGQRARTPTDTDKPEKRDIVAVEGKEGVPRNTEQETGKERKGRGGKDKSNSIEKGKEKRELYNLEERDREMTTTKKKDDRQKGSDKPETKVREEIVKDKERGEAQGTEAKVKGEKVKLNDTSYKTEVMEREKIKEGVRQGQSEADPLILTDTKERVKEKKIGEPRDSSQTETKDKEERMREKGKIEKVHREKIKNSGPTEVEVLGKEEMVKERKRGGDRDADKGAMEEEIATKRKKKDKNTPEVNERGAEAKDGEDKVKEKKRRDKDKKRKSNENDDL